MKNKILYVCVNNTVRRDLLSKNIPHFFKVIEHALELGRVIIRTQNRSPRFSEYSYLPHKMPLLIISKVECLLIILKNYPSLLGLFCFYSTGIISSREITGD